MIGFYFRESNARSLEASENLKKLLSGSGLKHRDLNEDTTKAEDCADIDLIIVFGGDGSVLRASKISRGDIPIVAINTGNVGFLTSYEESNLNELVEAIKNNSLKFTERRFMSVTVGDREYLALNDAVITKNYTVDNASECVRLGFTIDGQFVDSYVADGLILSTPTGSTAYAISAGGPIMAPNVDAFVAAPICAHSLHSRPIVYSSSSVAEVRVDKKSKECALFIDGKFEDKVPCGGLVTVKLSGKYAKICDNSGKFFLRLSEKLTKWSIADTKNGGTNE